MAMTDYLRNKLLGHTLTATDYPVLTDTWLALFTADPTVSGSFLDEVATASYVRESLTGKFDLNGGVADTNIILQFPIATEPWGVITHVGIVDAATAGNLLFIGAASSPETIDTDDTYAILSGHLSITLI